MQASRQESSPAPHCHSARGAGGGDKRTEEEDGGRGGCLSTRRDWCVMGERRKKDAITHTAQVIVGDAHERTGGA